MKGSNYFPLSLNLSKTMRCKVLFIVLSHLLFSKVLLAHVVLSHPLDSIYSVINEELNKAENANYDKIAASLNLLEETAILQILKNKGILAGEHTYNAEKLWKLHLAALSLGTHSHIALCLRRTNKFQTAIEAKERVRDEILAHLSAHQSVLPKWLDFNDLNIVENKKLGASHAEITGYFRTVKAPFTDDEAWCAAYVGAKMKAYDVEFNLPQHAFRAASYGGFSDSGFHFNKTTKNNKNQEGRYSNLSDLDYIPQGQWERYYYTIEDFKDKNKIPFGALVIFKRQGGGHIGFVVGTVKDDYLIQENGNLKRVVREGIVILGGNQNDAVQFEIFYDLDKIRAVTMPAGFFKEDYSAIPEIKAFYDLPEFYQRERF